MMEIKNWIKYILGLAIAVQPVAAGAQITQRERPAHWESLVPGARFMDRFMPMQGSELGCDTWGAAYVRPRYVDNGIEDAIWSYWGGNIIKGDDGRYHQLVCGWLEASDKGHMEWPDSYVFHAVADSVYGPFKPVRLIGRGHNPEVYRLADGRYVLYVIGGRYVADDINGKWEYGKFDFDTRDRNIVEGLSNLSFARRADGSFIMVDRGGGIWVSRDGISTYHLVTQGSVYPKVEGRFEDPVIWKDNVQYNLIVNDWLGRIAYYLRSANGVEWTVDDGEAYMPGIAVHPDGTKEDWFKYERMKVYQDGYGRPVQANFAVIDTIKWEDKPYDNHSSKNITIPLNPGMLLMMLESPRNMLKVEIAAERGFNPAEDLDVESLRFGAPADVDYGRGCKATGIQLSSNGAIVTFDAKGYKPGDGVFAMKMTGHDRLQNPVYGYARVSGQEFDGPLLSARAPRLSDNGNELHVTVENFGLVSSRECRLVIKSLKNGAVDKEMTRGKIAPVEPYASRQLSLLLKKPAAHGDSVVVEIYEGKKPVSAFTTEIK